MKLFEYGFVYWITSNRWLYKIYTWYWNIRWLFSNLYRFRKTLWTYRSFDWEGLYQAMYDSLEGIEECQRKHSYHIGADRLAKKARIALHLIDRLKNDCYYEVSGYSFERIRKGDDFEPLDNGYYKWVNNYEYVPKNRAGFKHSYRRDNAIEKQDREMLFNILNKYSKSMWS